MPQYKHFINNNKINKYFNKTLTFYVMSITNCFKYKLML